jgi:glycolate oxidase subunit GlcD
MSGLQRDLERLLGGEALRTGDAAETYLHDATEMQGLRGWADAVVVPQSTADVARLVAWCYKHGISIVPRGGGTGFAGGAVPFGGVLCSLEGIDHVRSLEPENWSAEVEAGVVTARVHNLARSNGLFFAPDPGASSQSQIGGNVACNAGGPHSFKYGSTGVFVTGIEAVIADGDVVRFGGHCRKDVATYDLRSVLVGSEGTLGILTRIWLRLLPAPEVTLPVAAAYSAVADGVEALRRVYGHGLLPATLEYFDEGALAAAGETFPRQLPANTRFLILSESDGGRDEAEALRKPLEEALAEKALSVAWLEESGDLRAIQRWRSGVSYAVSAQRGGKVSEDIAVPFANIEAAIEGAREIGERIGLPSCSWGHAGDGIVHATFLIDARSSDDLSKANLGIAELFELSRRLGGTVTGEHGLGWVKRGQLEHQVGTAELKLLRGIKDIFDPAHLFNPGKKGMGGGEREVGLVSAF